MTYMKEFTKGIIKENPVLILLLGTCPTLAMTTSATNAVGMGVAATCVLIGSNAVISMLKKVIPDAVRIPSYITIVATFVTIVQMIVKAFSPELNDALGVYLPLIVVNCIILGRAEMFANKNKVIPSILDGAGMGVGFTLALTVMSIVREFLGTGCIFGIEIAKSFFESLTISPITIFILPAGGFFMFGVLIAVVNKISKKPQKETACASCHLAKSCSKIKDGGECK
ncbi:MAG: electron transport complex subunit E [Clostridia bacterium]